MPRVVVVGASGFLHVIIVRILHNSFVMIFLLPMRSKILLHEKLLSLRNLGYLAVHISWSKVDDIDIMFDHNGRRLSTSYSKKIVRIDSDRGSQVCKGNILCVRSMCQVVTLCTVIVECLYYHLRAFTHCNNTIHSLCQSL